MPNARKVEAASIHRLPLLGPTPALLTHICPTHYKLLDFIAGELINTQRTISRWSYISNLLLIRLCMMRSAVNGLPPTPPCFLWQFIGRSTNYSAATKPRTQGSACRKGYADVFSPDQDERDPDQPRKAFVLPATLQDYAVFSHLVIANAPGRSRLILNTLYRQTSAR
ncbi:hypothetical protein IF1G_05669 [Cordyceps javanica]|uniref:Uncharacterized protein n=1 Tax=Cordyceps javanica TaxID=43265 RepID=A0A545V298_9HYPO|nr:hypothetical protein IF1G_05669 [Cordyceps javanica]